MNIWAVVNVNEDEIWARIDLGSVEEDEGAPRLYSTLQRAEDEKFILDLLDRGEHFERERVRHERWTAYREARSVLEINKFQQVDDVMPPRQAVFEAREFQSKWIIVTLEVRV